MTNFKPLMDDIWLAAKDNNVEKFESACKHLMERGVEDLFRIGWELYPKKIEDVYDLLDDISEWCHKRWIEAMQRGDAPGEDVSPGEGPMLVKKVIQDALKKKEEEEGENEEQAAEDKGSRRGPRKEHRKA